MNYSAAGKVQCTHISDPPPHSPYPVADWVIDQSCPEYGKNKECLKFHPLRKCSCNHGWCNHRKHHLKYHKCLVRDCGRIIRIRFKTNAIQPQPFQAADNSTLIRSECKAVPP